MSISCSPIFPGLIEGAHEGVGIGDRFLGHIERCRVILHLVDVNEADVAEAYRTVRREMRAYGGGLDKKREIVALSKCDTVTPERAAEQAERLKKACRKKPIRTFRRRSKEHVDKVLRRLVRDPERGSDPKERIDREDAQSAGEPRLVAINLLNQSSRQLPSRCRFTAIPPFARRRILWKVPRSSLCVFA